MPAQVPGTSEQVVQTDPDLITAVERRWGALHVDLAATVKNTQAAVYISKEINSLVVPWCEHWPNGRMWLNPEFTDLTAWSAKCAQEAPRLRAGGLIFLLTPASVGANWFANHVHGKAHVIALQGRLKFVGHKQGYPKDCILSVYGEPPGFSVWDWRPSARRVA